MYDIQNATIKVYNLYGREIENPSLEFGESTHYSSVLTWNCASQNPGIYFIYVNLHGADLTIPVVVAR